MGDKSTIQSIAIVKLFTASQNSFFEYSNITGILCLVWDREREAPFFRIFSPDTLILIYESELYIDFHKVYRRVNDHFYYFELIRGNHTYRAKLFIKFHEKKWKDLYFI